MNALDFPVYDADQHFYEPPEAFLRHLPKKYAHDFQYVEVNGRTKMALDGVISNYIPNPTFDYVAAPGVHEKYYRGQNAEGLSMREMTGTPLASQPEFHNGAAHLKAMDKQGIHAALVFPTLASIIEERLTHKPETMQALMHSLNCWVQDEYGFGNGRQYPVAAINLSDVDGACKELDFVLKAGAKAILIRPAPAAGLGGTRSIAFPEFDPFWARVNESKVLVTHHVSDSGYTRIYDWWTAGGKGEFRPFERDPFLEMIDPMGRPISDALSSLICHGLFDRFPSIRVAALENGSFWVEYLLQRFKSTYGKMPHMFKRDPIETFREHIYVAPFYEDNIEKLVDLIGVERILFGSDWPHPEGLAEPTDYIKEFAFLAPADREKVMSSNLKSLLERAG